MKKSSWTGRPRAKTGPKAEVKLVLNMLMLAMAGIPRGGVVTVAVDGRSFNVTAKGERAKVPQAMADVLTGAVAA